MLANVAITDIALESQFVDSSLIVLLLHYAFALSGLFWGDYGDHLQTNIT